MQRTSYFKAKGRISEWSMIDREMCVPELGSSDETMCTDSSFSPSGDLKVAKNTFRSSSGVDAHFELFSLPVAPEI